MSRTLVKSSPKAGMNETRLTSQQADGNTSTPQLFAKVTASKEARFEALLRNEDEEGVPAVRSPGPKRIVHPTSMLCGRLSLSLSTCALSIRSILCTVANLRVQGRRRSEIEEARTGESNGCIWKISQVL